jgi:hypothetical protein
MKYPRNYIFGYNESNIKKDFPNLHEDNFSFTSIRTDLIQYAKIDYNCCAWALGRTDKRLDMTEGFLEELELDENNINHTAEAYAKDVYTKYKFEICNDGNLEKGFEKIVLYEDENGLFSHVSRQLQNGNWTSKLGHWEDIEHSSIYDLVGCFYGTPKIFMKKPI